MRKLLPVLLIILIFLLSTTAYAVDENYYSQYKNNGMSINVYNWGEYISNGEDDSINVNKEFEALTGIKVNYATFATNEELYAKLKSGGSSYDIIIPSDYMVARMIKENMLEKLNFTQIPNFDNIDANFVNMAFDPKNEYSVPYTWGTVGIIYNTEMVDEDEDVGTWDVLWNEKYLGNILMFGNPRDAFAISLRRLGYSMNAQNSSQLQEATAELKLQKPLVQAYVMDEIFDKMVGGEAAIAPYYAGDALTMIADNPSLAFAFPREGTNRFVDAVCIPIGARNKEAAQMYINFLCEPEIGAANAEYIGYSTPNMKSLELLDDEIKENKIAYPDESIIENTEFFLELSHGTSLMMDKLWTDLLTSDQQYSRWFIPIMLIVCVAISIGINLLRYMRKQKAARMDY